MTLPAAQNTWVVRDVEGGDDHGHERARHDDVAAEAGDETEGQRGEVVGDLVLGKLVAAEADDRQDPEQAEPEARADGRAQQDGADGHDTQVHPDVGDEEVSSVVAREVHADHEGEDGDDVEAEVQEGGGGHDELRILGA